MSKRYEHVVCGDGFMMSVQAHDGAYCCPRIDNAIAYSEVEVGFPSSQEILLMKYAENPREPTQTVYAYVPAATVVEIIVKHDGMKSGEIPPLDLTPGIT